MPRTILIYASVPIWEYHHAESVELALSHIQAGDIVHILTCRGALTSCAANARHIQGFCNLCREQQRRTRKILGNKVTWHTISLSGRRSTPFPSFRSIADLRDFKVDGVPHGALAASQLVDDLRDGYPELEKHNEACTRLLQQSVELYQFAKNLISEIGAQHVYVWNGRRPSDGPVIWAARKLCIPFTSHIWDYDEPWEFSRGFIVIEGSTFHDLNRMRQAVRLEGASAALTAAERKVAESYLDSITSAGRRMFGANFRDTDLKFLSPGVRKIGIFTTSEWEFAGEPTWENRLYQSQWAGIEAILTDSRLRDGIQFIVRLHPNLVNSPRDSGEWKAIRAVQALAGPAVHFVEPEDPVDSYSLLQACDAVVTFGSTVGIEASLRGKPVVLLGRCLYEGAGICYEPASHDEAVDLLLRRLDAMPRDNVLRYAYRRFDKVWHRIELRHLRLDAENHVHFRGYPLFRYSIKIRMRGLVGRLARWVLRWATGVFQPKRSRNA